MARRRLYFDLVSAVLKDVPEARSSDERLFAELLRRYDVSLPENERESVIVCFSDWGSPIRYDTVRRTRQRVQQNCPELRPTSEVRRGRRIRAEEIVEELKE